MRIFYKLILLISVVLLLGTLPISYFMINKSQEIILNKTLDVCTNIASNLVTIARDELFLDATYQNTANLIQRLKQSKIKALDNIYIINVYGKYVVEMKDVHMGKNISMEEVDYFKKIDESKLEEIKLEKKRLLRFSYPVYLDEEKLVRIGMVVLDFNKKHLYQPVEEIQYFAILLGLGVFFITLIFTIITSILFTRPINSLSEALKLFSEGKFSHRIQLESGDELGKLANAFNTMVESIEAADSLKNSYIQAYQKFVPMEVVKFLEKESILDIKLGDQVQKEMTILFSDIRSFTTLSEQMNPEENFNFINSYFKRMGPIVRKHNGFVDKYIGDAIMALFPYSVEDAIDAAIEMQLSIQTYNKEREKVGYSPIAVGIGIHTGNLMLGTIGENERMEGTVISDSVNLASRLESLTKLYSAPIIISEKAFIKLGDTEKYNYRFLGNVKVKGKVKEVFIIELFDYYSNEKKEMMKETKSRFENAIVLYHAGDYEGAKKIFQEILKEYAEDETTKKYITQCEYALKYGVEKESAVD